MLNTKKRPSCNLSGKSQEKGRLTALIPVNVFIGKQNYTTWLAACDHDEIKVRNFVVKNITEIQNKVAVEIESIFTANNHLVNEDGNKRRFLGKNVKEINKKVNQEINNCLADLIDKGNIPRSPTFLLVRSWDFMNEGKASCGCLMSESNLLILNRGGKQVQTSLSAIAKQYGVDICTIKRRAKQPDMTLSEIVHGLNGRKENSISGSREKSKSVLRLIAKLKSQVGEKEAFQKISQQARLDVSHDFILRKRFFAVDRYSFRALAETDILDCSHEQVRKLELEMLDKIVEAFRLAKTN